MIGKYNKNKRSCKNIIFFIPDQNSFYSWPFLTKTPFIPDQNSFYSGLYYI